MAEAGADREQLAAPGLEVRPDLPLEVAALRYFGPDGEFVAAIRTATGTQIPEPLGATAVPGSGGEGPLILAWRSPTETLALTADRTRHAQLAARLASAPGGCLVELTGGLRVMQVCGERIAELLCRLGGDASIPQLGEARPCRLADVPVLALCVANREMLLAVDRMYARHLLGWIRATLADWPDA